MNYINLNDFVATFQQEEIKFSGIVANSSNRPVLVPRIKILVVREDRKIILEKIITLQDRVIKPNSKIIFKEIVKAKLENENISVKAILLEEVFDY